MLFRTVVVALTLLSFTACTSMRPIEDVSPAKIHQYVHKGDEVHIVLASGAVYDLVVTKVEPDSLVGRADSGKHWRIKYEAIQHIEAEEPSAGKSVLTGGGITLVVLYVAAVVLFAEAFEDFGEAFGCMFGCSED